MNWTSGPEVVRPANETTHTCPFTSYYCYIGCALAIKLGDGRWRCGLLQNPVLGQQVSIMKKDEK